MAAFTVILLEAVSAVSHTGWKEQWRGEII